jgi:hypothetical protein
MGPRQGGSPGYRRHVGEIVTLIHAISGTDTMLRFNQARIEGIRVVSTFGSSICRSNVAAIDWLENNRVMVPHQPDPTNRSPRVASRIPWPNSSIPSCK